MPELPEVETIRRGIAPFLLHRQVRDVVVRATKLRWPVSPELGRHLSGQTLLSVERRGKYLLLRFARGTLLIHLGMSGYLRILQKPKAAGRHDHADLIFSGGVTLRLNDARRFGALIWIEGDPHRHPLLAGLGPEPLSPAFDGDYLFCRSRNRRLAVKPFLMDHRVVVGVGNIYANEALFRAGIDPRRPAGSLSAESCRKLAAAVRKVLTVAIEAGGTTLRDFSDHDGRPGYFALQLQVYGREGESCPGCGGAIEKITLGQRSTYFCNRCQR
jgi:formamidopyrimidine-DNA glycosylase